ncbi:ERMES complex subunit mmm1 [Nowakowskiella sp. JEL0407]|nr:ERMES complex subunit mmm1 [Nowakowskiella sp. JEL0407]
MDPVETILQTTPQLQPPSGQYSAFELLKNEVNLASQEFFKGADGTKNELNRRRNIRPKVVVKGVRQPNVVDGHILENTQYKISSNREETCDWLNVMIAQLLAKYRNDAGFNNRIVTVLDEIINKQSFSTFVGPVTITELSLGESYPRFYSAAIRVSELTSNLRGEVKFNYDDQITIGIDTQVLINWPKSAIASLPVSLTMSIVKLSGTIAFEFVTHPESAETHLSITILEDFNLEFEVKSLLGHRTKVKDLPKLSSMIVSKLRSRFIEEIVWPNSKRIRMPMLWSDLQEKAEKL